MKDSLRKEIEASAAAVEESILWWEKKLDVAAERYEKAIEAGDYEELEKIEEEMKNLLARAQLEKVEMARIEAKLNEACVDAAFNGAFSSSKKKKSKLWGGASDG